MLNQINYNPLTIFEYMKKDNIELSNNKYFLELWTSLNL